MPQPRNWSLYGIQKRFQNAALVGIDRTLFQDVFEYAESAEEFLVDGRGLLLSGPPGIGKTWALAALMMHIAQTTKRPFDFQMVTAPDLVERAYPERGSYPTDAFRAVPWTQVYEGVTALVINDLGKENRAPDWVAEQANYRIGRVLRARHERSLPVFFTTNLSVSPSDIEKTYGPSIWSLIYDLTVFRTQIVADDRRKKQ